MNYKVYLTSSAKAKKLKKIVEPCIVAIEPEDFTKKEIAALKEKGYTVLGYLSVGSVSDERSYYKKLKPYCLKKLDDWPHEWYIDLRKTAVRDWCVSRAKEIKEAGCNGWWLDNVDVYEEYESNAMYNAVLSVLRRIKGIGGYVMINGGSKFLQDKMKNEANLGAYKVQCGAFGKYENAEELVRTLKKQNFSSIIKTVETADGKILFKVQTGAYSNFSNAYEQMCGLKTSGMSVVIMLEGGDETEIPINKYVDGVTQEEVLTRITDYSGKGKFGSQTTKQSSFYKEHMCRVNVHGVQTFLLEYSNSSDMVKKIKQFVNDYGMTGYYCSSDVNL